MTMMDQYYKLIFRNKNLRNNIIQYIHVQNAVSKKYCDIQSVGWMIKNKHVGLLRDKLAQKEYLYLVPEDIPLVFSLGMGLFKVVLERFNDYFPITEYSQYVYVSYAAANNDFELMKYFLLINGNIDSVFKSYDPIHGAAKSNNVEMVKYLFHNYSIRFPLGAILESLRHRNLELLTFFTSNKKHLAKTRHDEYYMQEIWKSSAEDLELFKLMEKTFKSKLRVDFPFIELAVKHYNLIEYILQNYNHQFLLTYSYPATRPPVISILESLTKSGSLKTIELLDRKGLLTHASSYAIIAHQALLSNQIGIYNYAKQKDPSISVNVALHQIEGVMKDVQLVVMYQEMGAQITSECVIQACTSGNLGVFVYIFESMNPTTSNSRIRIDKIDYTESIVKKCLASNNATVLEYLCKNGYLSTIDINLLHEYQIKIGKNSELELVKFILTHATKMDALSIYYILLEAALTSSVEVFKFVYPYHTESKLLNTEQIFNLVNAGAKKGCLEIVKLIMSSGNISLPPREVLFQSICSNFDMLSFFYDNHFPLVFHGVSISCKKALQTEQWECAKYLMNKFTVKYNEVLMGLLSCPNFELVQQFLAKCNPIPAEDHKRFYLSGVGNGYLDVAKHFYRPQVTVLIDTLLFVSVVQKTYVHMLEYIKSHVFTIPKTFSTLRLSKDLLYYDAYKPYIINYCGITPRSH
ncbi:hypothetical protein CYY_005448 [Polysphondylium violaceum]|uniref:Ankyrin repeat-containing protein n=1 Tax=Polysphondylium violaceum TaxID=133409 RepID=A0A8J4PTS4_9MYCE|nr:hypothetical protein CYY_005448 [Polysphondylium violaceum]